MKTIKELKHTTEQARYAKREGVKYLINLTKIEYPGCSESTTLE